MVPNWAKNFSWEGYDGVYKIHRLPGNRANLGQLTRIMRGASPMEIAEAARYGTDYGSGIWVTTTDFRVFLRHRALWKIQQQQLWLQQISGVDREQLSEEDMAILRFIEQQDWFRLPVMHHASGSRRAFQTGDFDGDE